MRCGVVDAGHCEQRQPLNATPKHRDEARWLGLGAGSIGPVWHDDPSMHGQLTAPAVAISSGCCSAE